MEQFWKWLMKADAKGLFVLSLLLLGGVTAWWAVDYARAPKKAAAEAAAKPPPAPLELAEFKPIGVIGFVSNQFAPETLIVPVNPFHPTFEAIVKVLVRQSESGVIVISDKDGKPVEVHFENGVLVDAKGTPVASPFQRDLTPRQPGQIRQQQVTGAQPPHRWVPPPNVRPKPQPQKRPPPKPQVSFMGMMQRPDGSFASFVSIKTGNKSKSQFVAVGDKLGDATVTASGREGVELTFADGTRTLLRIGDPPVILGEAEAQ